MNDLFFHLAWQMFALQLLVCCFFSAMLDPNMPLQMRILFVVLCANAMKHTFATHHEQFAHVFFGICDISESYGWFPRFDYCRTNRTVCVCIDYAAAVDFFQRLHRAFVLHSIDLSLLAKHFIFGVFACFSSFQTIDFIHPTTIMSHINLWLFFRVVSSDKWMRWIAQKFI